MIESKPWARRTALALAGSIAITAMPAWADGTLALSEVLVAVEQASKLVTEINFELGKVHLKPEDVTCIGARHGNHWTYLGGARAAPYECTIGPRTVKIEADRIYFDPRDRVLGDQDKTDPKQAKAFRESNFRWTWAP
jgi:hypothetical protein